MDAAHGGSDVADTNAEENKTMISWRVRALAIVSLFAIGCGGSTSYNSPTVTPAAPTPATTNEPISTIAISIPSGASTLGANAFNPNPLNVASGTTVTWTNADSVAHTSTSDASGWDSATLGPGQQFKFTFSTSGTFHYHCAIHPGMVGTIAVQ